VTLDRRALLQGLVAGGVATLASGTASAREREEPGAADVGMLYDATLCIGCKACVVRCREVSGLPPATAHGPLWDAPDGLEAGTKNVIKLARDGGHTSYVKQQCMHCVDPACVSACMLSALHRLDTGVVAYDRDTCVGCRYCEIVCPFGVPTFEYHSATPKIVKCEMCRDRQAKGLLPGCVEVCPRKAVIFGKRAELLAEAKARIAARPDAYQSKVYGETDGGGTHVLYLSALPFAALGLPDIGPDSPAYSTERVQDALYQGFVGPIALYGALAFVTIRNRKKTPPGEGEES
jgi:Fe-S-cluster-containing dehydrogenase component